jgi:hypothetical protein
MHSTGVQTPKTCGKLERVGTSNKEKAKVPSKSGMGAGKMAQVAECLTSKGEALYSNSSIIKINK